METAVRSASGTGTSFDTHSSTEYSQTNKKAEKVRCHDYEYWVYKYSVSRCVGYVWSGSDDVLIYRICYGVEIDCGSDYVFVSIALTQANVYAVFARHTSVNCDSWTEITRS